MINGLRLGFRLWSGVRLRRMVNCLGLGLGFMCRLRLSVMVWA